MKKVKARKDQISSESNRGVTAWVEGMKNVDLYRGHARFVDASTIEVNGEQLKADKIFIGECRCGDQRIWHYHRG